MGNLTVGFQWPVIFSATRGNRAFVKFESWNCIYVGYLSKLNSDKTLFSLNIEGKEGNVSFNNAHNTFYLWLYGVRPISERKPAADTWATLF